MSANQIVVRDEQNLEANSGGQFAPTERLLNALSTVLSETLERFEATSGKVTETVLSGGHAEDHDLIVALQDFDRIHQEFSAIKNVISRYVATSVEHGNTQSGHDAISAVTLSHLKARLLNCLDGDLIDDEPAEEEAEF
jgi:hypothetical protein